MKIHVLFELLKTLNRKEMTRFKDFVMSPYYNKHEGLRAIVGYLSGIYPQFREKTCSHEAIAKAVFSEQPEEGNRLPVLLTYLHRLLYQFLDADAYRVGALSESVYLWQQLWYRRQSKAHSKQLEKKRQAIAQDVFRDSAYYYGLFLLEKEADRSFVQSGNSLYKDALRQKSECLDIFYLSEKLKDACEMSVRSRLMKVDSSSPLTDALLQVIAQNEATYFEFPPIQVYHRLYQMIHSQGEEDYKAAFVSVQKYAANFPKEELQNLYNYLQNHCIYLINKGKASFLSASFDLYKIQLEKKLLFVDEELPEWHYKNIVSVALRLEQSDWVRRFLEDYRYLLPKDVRDNAYAYNLAEYYYATKKYRDAMHLLLQVQFTNPRYSLSAKALLLKIYYELDEYESLMALGRSFVLLLHRKKAISEFRRKGYKNLFKLTMKAAQLRYRQSFTKKEKYDAALEKLKSEMVRTEPIFNRYWLERQVETL